MKNRLSELRYLYFSGRYGQCISKIMSLLCNKICLPCFEIPITTFCTLRCKNCANLIQYYDNPYHVEEEYIISDISRVLESIDKIGCVRILGGEPILSPALHAILCLLVESEKVDNIVIVTNGTLMLDENLINIMRNTRKIKVSISDYGDVSRNIGNLEKQLSQNGVKYEERKVEWREKRLIPPNGLGDKALKEYFSVCPNKFFSLLNGRIYICPKAAHADDLGLVMCNDVTEFVELRKGLSRNDIRRQIIKLIEKDYVGTCRYCNEYNNANLRIVASGEQCTKEEAMQRLENMKKLINGGTTDGY